MTEQELAFELKRRARRSTIGDDPGQGIDRRAERALVFLRQSLISTLLSLYVSSPSHRLFLRHAPRGGE